MTQFYVKRVTEGSQKLQLRVFIWHFFYVVKFCSIIYTICVVYVNSVCYGICLSLTFRFVSYGRTVKGSQNYLYAGTGLNAASLVLGQHARASWTQSTPSLRAKGVEYAGGA